MKRLQTGDIDYKEETAAAAVRNKIEVDGITAEQNAATIKVSFSPLKNCPWLIWEKMFYLIERDKCSLFGFIIFL